MGENINGNKNPEKSCTTRHLDKERVESRIGNNERGYRVPVVLQVVWILSKVPRIFCYVVLLVLQVVQVVPQVVLANSNVGMVVLEMILAVTIVVDLLVEFLF